ncbi:MAG: PAS domain-containing protein [Deltaproteobacteria bacterium]|jgi:two-component system sensor histidine kinase PilS (NtrC family)|nr:PAS domain-containing protein [Deltaproteobacteria bacterium]
MDWFPGKIEKSRQKWLFGFRLLTNIFLTVIIVLIHLTGRTPDFLGYWSNVITIAMVMSFGFALAHYLVWPRFLGPAWQIAIQVLTDILWAFVLIIITGGCESALVFLFIIAVFNSAFLGGIKVAFVAATLATGAWAAIVDMHYYGYLPGLPPLGEFVSSSDLAVNILVNTGASYMVAILGGHLSSQLNLSSQALVSSQTTLDRLHELNESVVHSIDSGLITMDSLDRILSINQAAREILRLSAGEVLGRPWRFFFPELAHLERIPLKRPHLHGGAEGLRFVHRRPIDKVEVILELNMLALVDEDNERWGSLMVLKDLSAISQLEAENKKNEHLAAIGELAAGLAHEIRTPLASLKGSWELILSQNLRGEDQTRLTRIIGREMNRLDNLVNDFLSFARPPTGHPQALRLRELLEGQTQILKSWKRDEAEINLAPGADPLVFFDEGQLSQIVWNLLQNAIEAADPQRTLVIDIAIQASRVPGYVDLSIRDNGKGIAEEHVKRVFEPFYTTKPQGTGLGLATAWGMLKKGTGNITVSSTPGAFTVFTLTLPLAQDALAAGERALGPLGDEPPGRAASLK